jgi:NhaA family Na+:H+ antiporter
MRARAGEAESPGLRLEHVIAPFVAWMVLPLFGLANAGLPFGDLPSGVVASPVFLGIAGGLFIGKQAGIFGATRLAAALGLARLPAGLSWRHLYGVALLCGIGFTMSLFVAELAFYGDPVHGEAKLAVFAGSLLSALGGLAMLAGAPAETRPG